MAGARTALLALSLCLFAVTVFAAPQTECGECDRENCPPPEGCLAGMVKDRCGCCFVCGGREGERCDHPRVKTPPGIFYGACGDQLECRLREDGKDEDAPEALCFCKKTETLCGTDGKTYSNICQLMEEAYKTRSGLKTRSSGPCRAAPWIVTGPDDVTEKSGSNVALSCEVMGFPIPSIEWHMTPGDGVTFALPSDDQHVAVQARGGPEQYEVTGWLQLLEITTENEGTYHCVARNEEGEVRGSARLIVKEDGSNELEK